MQMRKLGTMEVSVVGYGAWEAGGSMWGSEATDRDVVAAMEAAVDAGMNWIDTAEAYGDGRSEELVGEVAGRHRGDVLVFTKVAHFVSGSRADDVKRAIRGSLRRLGIDHVDLYQVHWPDERHTPIEETWGAMAEVQDAGLARHIGLSNVDRGLVERCLTIRHVDSVQNQLSLLHRDDEQDLLPWLHEHGVGYLAYGPLGFGLLTGAFTRETTFDDDDWRSGKMWQLGYYREMFAPGRFEQHLERVDRLKPIAARLGVSVATLALRAAIDTPGVTAVIAGSRKANHVRSNAAAGAVRLDAGVRREIEDAIGA